MTDRGTTWLAPQHTCTQNGMSAVPAAMVPGCIIPGFLSSALDQSQLTDDSIDIFVLQSTKVAWFRYGVGITVTGSGVSQWRDQSGNGRHLLQATDAARPALQADGSILCNGTSHFVKTAPFTFNQPKTIYLLWKQVTWTDGDYLFDGDVNNSGAMLQGVNGTPTVRIAAGLTVNEAVGNWPVNTHAAHAIVFNGANSSLRIGNIISASGDAGTNNMGGFILAAIGDGNVGWSNIQAKEVILYSGAHDTATQDKIIDYLSRL